MPLASRPGAKRPANPVQDGGYVGNLPRDVKITLPKRNPSRAPRDNPYKEHSYGLKGWPMWRY